MKSLYRYILLFTLFLSTQLTAEVVGTTKGEFSVNQGTANYNLKIDVPPGVAGMEPKLSLNYSSNGVNGYMGIGWSIGGVSAITRCPQTKAVDGENHTFGVNYDSNDRFCLDGQRLINISGTYGADGTEYRTEIDSYAKITSKSDFNGGPLWFEVKTKSGLTYIYGRDNNAALATKYNGAMKFWSVAKIIDTYANEINFHYLQDVEQGYHYLDKVTYADNTVQYNYEPRIDVVKVYHRGSIYLVDKRLKEVVITTNSTEARSYSIIYENLPDEAKRSKVISIIESVVEGELKALTMAYQNTTGKLIISDKTPKTQAKDAVYADFNGDGFIDVYNNNQISLGNGNGDFSDWSSLGINVANDAIKFADFDGDGDIDFVVSLPEAITTDILEKTFGKEILKVQFIPPDQTHPPLLAISFADGTFTTVPPQNIITVYNNDGNGIFTKGLPVIMFYSCKDIKLTDINGDGRVDIYTKGSREIYLNQGNSVFVKGDKIGINATIDNLFFFDFNGDGLTDIYEVVSGADNIYINDGNMNFQNTYSPYISATYDNLKFADLNGDGSVDVYEVVSGNDKVWINNGKGNLTHTYSPPITSTAENIKLIDINNDSFLDLYILVSGNNTVRLNDGKGNFPEISYTIPVVCTSENLHFVDINGDDAVDMIEADSTNKIWFNQIKRPLLTNITNHTDQDISISYKNMTDTDIYHNYSVNGQRNAYPWNDIANDNIEISSSTLLVHTVSSANGVGGTNSVRYKYYGYIVNKLRGSQGFHAIDTIDETTQMYSTTYYKQIEAPNGEGFQYTGLPEASYEGRDDTTGTMLSKTVVTYEEPTYLLHGIDGTQAKIHQPYTGLNLQTVYEPDSDAEIKTVSHSNTLSEDGLGNIVSTTDQTVDLVNNKTFLKTTINEYENEDADSWIIGRLTKASVVHAEEGNPNTIAKSSTFTYNSNGVLSQEVANAGTPLALTKNYVYDTYGNKIQETVSGSGLTTATTTYGYSDDGKFQTSATNALGLTETRSYDTRFGTLSSLTGPNGLTTSWSYDSMGRKISEVRADGTQTTWSHNWDDGSLIGANHAVYAVTQSSTGSPDQITYYDSLGREVGSYTFILGNRVQKLKTYNNKGELTEETLPHYANDTVGVISTTYDKYGRAVSVTKPGPDNQLQTYTTVNTNFTSTVTDPNGQKKQTVQNAIGQTISITDAKDSGIDSSIHYTYDAMGNLLTTTDSEGNVITMAYDAQGNKSYMSDPDLGVWNYTYNAAGQIISQTNSKGQTTTTQYDILGRVTSKISQEGTSVNETTYTYADSSAANGTKGKLVTTVSSSMLDGTDSRSQTQNFSYDALGRAISTTTTISGRGTYVSSMDYYTSGDEIGKPKTLTYPNGYTITNQYNSGILSSVVDSNGTVHYQVDALNAFGEVAQATFANGVKTKNLHDVAGFTSTILSGLGMSTFGDVQRLDYTYDKLGNVLSRVDTSIDGKIIDDTFTYDAMNRLSTQTTSSDVVGNFATYKEYRYDTLGNMTFQTGIGDYTYYADKPHAVKTAGTRTYTYDAVGNMTNRNGDLITYNPLNKPAVMTNSSNGQEVRFYYGVDGARYMKTTLDKDTYYLGKGYEEQVEGSEEKQIVYIYVGGKVIGSHTQVLNTDYVPTNEFYAETPFNRYFHTDALGSITAITDDTGTVVERRSYEPFGKIRAMDYGTNDNSLIPNKVIETNRAFTGHEQIAELSGLIHMNARVYDSDIGRFLSADTIIQDPHDSQSYNRYSYVRNNPLVFTDPSGHSWFSKLWKKIKDVVIGVVVAVLAVITAGAVLYAFGYTSAVVGSLGYGSAFAAAAGLGDITALLVSGAVAGFAAGVAGSLLYGESFGTALKAGFKSALWGAVGAGVAGAIGGAGFGAGFEGNAARALAHGLTRAGIAKAQGGKWSAGFWSGFAASALSPLSGYADSTNGKMAISAIVGGTASELGGGKFANGSVSAAFVYMYNDMAHGGTRSYGRKGFISSLAATGAALINMASVLLSDIVDYFDSKMIYYHYSNIKGTVNIAESGTILPGRDGRVYVSRYQLSVDEAQNTLFIGASTHEGRGEYVTAFVPRDGVQFHQGQNPYEEYHIGALRDHRSIDIIYSGPNRF